MDQTGKLTGQVTVMKIKLFSEIPCLQEGALILRRVEDADAGSLKELILSDRVYRYLPTFLFEKKYDDVHLVISRLYTECLTESLILGVFLGDDFCGLAELYGFKDHIHKVSVGYRLLVRYWGQGIATKTLKTMIRYLHTRTDIEIITASTMVENRASARVLQKNGFTLVAAAAPEDWGYDQPTVTDKWIL